MVGIGQYAIDDTAPRVHEVAQPEMRIHGMSSAAEGWGGPERGMTEDACGHAGTPQRDS